MEKQLQLIVDTTEGVAASTQRNRILHLHCRSDFGTGTIQTESCRYIGAISIRARSIRIHLRSTSDQLKRFYSTVTFGDA